MSSRGNGSMGRGHPHGWGLPGACPALLPHCARPHDSPHCSTSPVPCPEPGSGRVRPGIVGGLLLGSGFHVAQPSSAVLVGGTSQSRGSRRRDTPPTMSPTDGGAGAVRSPAFPVPARSRPKEDLDPGGPAPRPCSGTLLRSSNPGTTRQGAGGRLKAGMWLQVVRRLDALRGHRRALCPRGRAWRPPRWRPRSPASSPSRARVAAARFPPGPGRRARAGPRTRGGWSRGHR